MVRPEKMSALPAGSAAGEQNSVAAQVREVVFMGETTRYALVTASGQTLLVKQANRAGLPMLAVDQAAVVTWAIADTKLVA